MQTRVEPPLQRLRVAHGELAWREAGAGQPLVLLHGIGSSSGSWAGQLDALAASFRVIAWDAPGYGGSAPLPATQPMARDYARPLDELLAALDVDAPIVVGHSLGSLVAAAWVAGHDADAAAPASRALVLASPARGYGTATPAQREAKYRERVDAVETLGIAGMAASRSARLCAPGASVETVERVRRNMECATPRGYLQAAYMLAHDDLATHLRRVVAPIAVLCGEFDAVTPPAACEEVARAVGASFTLLRGVAHACYVEDAAQFNAALQSSLRALEKVRHG